MADLPVQRYQFNCQMHDTLKLNNYSGSMLRGAFGKALRKIACMTGMKECSSCLLYRQCAYPKIFETPTPRETAFQKFSKIPNPFVLEPPTMGTQTLLPGDVLSFNMVLIGQALECLPIIIVAWQTALKTGLSTTNAHAELVSVIFEPEQLIAQEIYANNTDSRLLPSPKFTPEPPLETQEITLEILTPLHIQQNGKVLAHAMRGQDFLLALIRRYYFLEEFHTSNYSAPDFKTLASQAAQVEAKTQFRWCEWQRYSNRQQQAMTFIGVLGKLQLTGNLQPFLSQLTLGQWLHVGNKTTFGMGKYRILTERL